MQVIKEFILQTNKVTPLINDWSINGTVPAMASYMIRNYMMLYTVRILYQYPSRIRYPEYFL